MYRTINIYTGNHRTITAIEDQLKILLDIFSKDFKVIINNDKLLSNGLNLIIEGFENPFSAKNLKKFKEENPNTKFILVLSEFFTSNLYTKSLNNFEKNFMVDLTVGIFLNQYLNFIIKKIFNSKKKFYLFLKKFYVNNFKKKISPKCNNYFLRKILKLKSDLNIFLSITANKLDILLFKALEYEKIKKIFENFEFKIFFKKRYSNLIVVKDIFDEILTVHPSITESTQKYLNKTSSTLYPYLPCIKLNKSIFNSEKKIIITGNFSLYRKKIIESLKKLKGKEYLFDIGGFESDDLIKKYPFALNVPQKKGWKFSSPIRILRSINFGQIPLNYKIFDDHPIEKICIEFNEETPRNFRKKVLSFNESYIKNIQKYNEYAKEKNKSIRLKLKKINVEFSNQELKTFFMRSENSETIISFLVETYVKNYKIYHQSWTNKFFAIKNNLEKSDKLFYNLEDFDYSENGIYNVKIKIVERFLKKNKLNFNKLYLIASTNNYDFVYFQKKFFITKKGENLKYLSFKNKKTKSFKNLIDCINAFVVLEKLKENSQSFKNKKSFLNFFLNNNIKNNDIRENIKFSIIE